MKRSPQIAHLGRYFHHVVIARPSDSTVTVELLAANLPPPPGVPGAGLALTGMILERCHGPWTSARALEQEWAELRRTHIDLDSDKRGPLLR